MRRASVSENNADPVVSFVATRTIARHPYDESTFSGRQTYLADMRNKYMIAKNFIGRGRVDAWHFTPDTGVWDTNTPRQVKYPGFEYPNGAFYLASRVGRKTPSYLVYPTMFHG